MTTDLAAPVRSTAAPKPRGSRAPLVALLLGTAGVVYRVVLTALEVPPTNSDEGTMGLAALHVLHAGEHPAFFYGQHYMGTLEAYLALPLVALTGPTVVALRLPAIVLYAAFLWLMYRLTTRLYPRPWFAVAVVGLLALGSDRVLKNEVIAAGGYPEINTAGAALLLLAIGLALGGGRRLARFAAWGLVAGLMLWDDWLLLPYLAVAGALLVAFCRRELAGRAGAALAGATMIGAAPLIWYNVTARPGQDSISVFLDQSHGGAATLATRLYNGVLSGVPMGTGLCQPNACGQVQLAWGAVYPVLLVLAGVLAWRALRAARERSARVVEAGRLALVVAAGASLLSYAQSSAAVHHPVESARYLHCLAISLPAVLWPLWSATGRLWRTASVALLAGLTAAMVYATGALVAYAPVYRAQARDGRVLIEALDRLHVTRMYADYWTCDRVVYLTGERIVCAVVGDDLGPGQDRYAPYRATVAAAPDAPYVFPVGSPQQEAYEAAGGTGVVLDVVGYRIYRSR